MKDSDTSTIGPAARHIVDRVLSAVAAHRLHPGTKLGEPDLGTIFGVSRVVVRQALNDLAMREVVTLARNKGASVASPSFADAMELYEALILIEQGIIGLLCAGNSPVAVDELRKVAREQQKAIHSRDDDYLNSLGSLFHELLGKLGRNRVIEDLHGNLLERTRILQMLYRRDFDEAHLCREHVQLVDCIEQGDAEGARSLMKDHYWRILRSYRFDEVLTTGGDIFEALREPDSMQARAG
jgi:DNA-binding GntR family transcriptional regulator